MLSVIPLPPNLFCATSIKYLRYRSGCLSHGACRKRERMADVLLHPPLLKIPARALALYR